MRGTTKMPTLYPIDLEPSSPPSLPGMKSCHPSLKHAPESPKGGPIRRNNLLRADYDTLEHVRGNAKTSTPYAICLDLPYSHPSSIFLRYKIIRSPPQTCPRISRRVCVLSTSDC